MIANTLCVIPILDIEADLMSTIRPILWKAQYIRRIDSILIRVDKNHPLPVETIHLAVDSVIRGF